LDAFARENETEEMFVTKKMEEKYCHKIPLSFVLIDKQGEGDEN
jgi:hypothetical protein